MRQIFNIQLLIIILCYTSFAQIEIMKGFDPGNYSVGFKYERIVDYSRSYDDGFRPVHLYIWYPSEEKSSAPFNYTHYLLLNDIKTKTLLTDQERQKELIDSLLRLEIEKREISGNTEEALSKYKNLTTIAQEGITVADSSFPLILFAPGGNTSGYLHSVICEYLASYGYIVVSMPSLGNSDSLRWPFDQTGLTLQIDDMAFAINHIARTFKKTNLEKICLISWSVGGVSQGIYSMKNPGIDMFISLDSGLGRTYGIEMLKASPYFDYGKIKIPYLHITGNQPEIYKVERSTEFYDSIASFEKHSLIIESFAHQHFSSQIGLIPALISAKKDKTIIASYKKMCYLTLIFTEAFLNGKSYAKNEWLELMKNYE